MQVTLAAQSWATGVQRRFGPKRDSGLATWTPSSRPPEMEYTLRDKSMTIGD